MEDEVEILNSINSKSDFPNIKSSASNPKIIEKSKLNNIISDKSSVSVVIKSTAAAIMIATSTSSVDVIKGTAEYINPNDFVSSCFGAGYWIEDLGWSESDAWVE